MKSNDGGWHNVFVVVMVGAVTGFLLFSLYEAARDRQWAKVGALGPISLFQAWVLTEAIIGDWEWRRQRRQLREWSHARQMAAADQVDQAPAAPTEGGGQ